MSVLTVLVVPSGILMAATETSRFVCAPMSGTEPNSSRLATYSGRRCSNGLTGLRSLGTSGWPGSRARRQIVGSTAFIGRSMPLGSIAHAAGELTAALNAEVPADDAGQPLIVHLAGFDTVDGELAPVVWFIHNTAGLTAEGRYGVGGRFASTEELRTAQPYTPRFVGMRANEINEALRARRWSNPFWFRQATDLGAANALDSAVAMAMTAIVETHPARLHPRPQSLTEWSQHLKLAVLTYGAYFESFYPPYEQAIGGGVDVVSVPWPE